MGNKQKQAYVTEKDGRKLIWLEFQVVINAPDDENLPTTSLGRGILITQEIALYEDEDPVTNAQIMANVGTDLISKAVVVRSRQIQLDENGYEIDTDDDIDELIKVNNVRNDIRH